MATNLGELKMILSGELNVGTKLDALLPSALRRAAGWIEREHPLPYMKTQEIVLLNPSIQVYQIQYRIRKVEHFFTYESYSDQTVRHFMQEVDFADFDTLATGRPSIFTVRGESSLEIGSNPDIQYVGNISYWHFTTFPTTDAGTHWLISYAEDFLLAQAKIVLAPALREPELIQESQAARDDAVRQLVKASEDLLVGGARQESMLYHGNLGE